MVSQTNFGYIQETYDVTNYCEVCGIGAVQRNSFRLLSEPTWGNKSILQLNWVYDCFFTTPEVYETVFRPFGIDIMPVVSHKTGKRLERVVQLIIERSANLMSYPTRLLIHTCVECSRNKYSNQHIGYFPNTVIIPNRHMVATVEYFGTDNKAYTEVLVTNKLYREIIANRLKGVSFRAMD